MEVLGIPHPPGAPLFVLVARAWSEALGWLPRAYATNLLSAVCTAAAGGILAWLFARWTGAMLAGVVAAIGAGAMSTVWRNATETELYAPSLLLSMCMLAAGHRAGVTRSGKWLILTAFTFALAVPLHLGALVAAPGAIVLAAADRHGHVRWGDAGLLSGALALAFAVGVASPLAMAAASGIVGAVIVSQQRRPPSRAVAGVTVMILGFALLAVLAIRAAHDPALNAGNPDSWGALWDLVGRAQYGGHRLFPRQAPLWIQLGNLLEYGDWQVALALTPDVRPSLVRTPITLLFVAFGVVGAMAHRRADARSWAAMIVTFVAGSIALAIYLNFKAGASFGVGVLPEDTPHEARERDYFFVLAIWVWGAWAGWGAVTFFRRIHPKLLPLGVAMAALPVALNWSAVSRRHEPDASLPTLVAHTLLESAPPDAVLITGGDNDSFPLWYLQEVGGVRRDVSVVVAPLLGARWYVEQLTRRDSLLERSVARRSLGEEFPLLAAIGDGARARGRPVAVALSAGVTRARLAGLEEPTLRGMVLVEGSQDADMSPTLPYGIDTVETARVAARLAGIPREVRPGVDPTAEAFRALLECPRQALSLVRQEASVSSLDSRCNPR